MLTKRLGTAAALILLSSSVVGCGDMLCERQESRTAEDVQIPAGGKVMGIAEQKDRIRKNFWVNSRITLREDGRVVGYTELRNESMVFSHTASVVVALVDANKQPLTYLDAGTWSIGGCLLSCPGSRAVTWSRQVPVEEWQRIRPEVKGIAVIQRNEPSHRVIDWLWKNKTEVIVLLKGITTLF